MKNLKKRTMIFLLSVGVLLALMFPFLLNVEKKPSTGFSVEKHVQIQGSSDRFRASADTENVVNETIRELFFLGKNEYAAWRADELLELQARLISDPKERRKVLWSLCRFDSPAVQDMISEMLKSELENEFLRADILSALMDANAVWINDLLLELIASKSDVVASRAVQAFGFFGGANAIDTLSQLAYDFNDDGLLSLAAAEALGNLDSEGGGRILMELFESGIRTGEDAAVEHALAGLGRIGNSEAEAYLTEVYGLATDPEIRVLIIEALDQEGGAGYAELTLRALSDPSDDVRASAAWFAAYQDKVLIEENILIDLILNEPSSQVRSHLYQAMDHIDELNFRPVMPMISSESDPQIRLSGCIVISRQLMDAEEQEYHEISTWLGRELSQLKQSEQLSKSELALVEQLINRAENR